MSQSNNQSTSQTEVLNNLLKIIGILILIIAGLGTGEVALLAIPITFSITIILAKKVTIIKEKEKNSSERNQELVDKKLNKGFKNIGNRLENTFTSTDKTYRPRKSNIPNSPNNNVTSNKTENKKNNHNSQYQNQKGQDNNNSKTIASDDSYKEINKGIEDLGNQLDELFGKLKF